MYIILIKKQKPRVSRCFIPIEFSYTVNNDKNIARDKVVLRSNDPKLKQFGRFRPVNRLLPKLLILLLIFISY